MIKIDLITGFLGSGKTTFLIKYAKYLKEKGEKICILENDYGAINVDMMLISEIGCDREMITSASDYETHQRRFKTKLISMAMRGYTRVIVEPSGIYDTDEFFDILYEDTISDLYEIGNIFCVYDFDTKDLSYESKYVMISEAAICGKLIVSKRKDKSILDLSYLNKSLEEFKCIRKFDKNDIIYEDELSDMSILDNIGYHNYDHIKIQINSDNSYKSLYFMNKKLSLEDIKKISSKLFQKEYGNVVRIKGFVFDKNTWYEINLTKLENKITPIAEGQDVVIVIGEDLNINKIESAF